MQGCCRCGSGLSGHRLQSVVWKMLTSSSDIHASEMTWTQLTWSWGHQIDYKWTWLFTWEGAGPFITRSPWFQLFSKKRGSEWWGRFAYIHCVHLGWPGLGAFPACACNSCVSRKAAWLMGRTSSYWGRARTLVFSCLTFPSACHGVFCKLIARSSLFYGMQGCPWKVSSFKLIMWSFCVELTLTFNYCWPLFLHADASLTCSAAQESARG